MLGYVKQILQGRRNRIAAKKLDPPNRDITLKGWIHFQRVYLIHSVAGKDYVCRECRKTVEKGTSHIIQRYLFRNRRGYAHHHVHRECVFNIVLPLMSEVEEIPYTASPLPISRNKRKTIPRDE